MTTPLKPGDRVLVEAVISTENDPLAEISAIVTINGLGDSFDAIADIERVHPLPVPADIVGLPSGLIEVWRGTKYKFIKREDAEWLIGPIQDGRVHLLAIPAKEGE